MGQMKIKDWLGVFSIITILFLLTYTRLHSLYDEIALGHNGLYLIFLLIFIFGFGFNLLKTSFDKLLLFLFLFCLPSILLKSNGIISLFSNLSYMLSLPGGFVLGKLLYCWSSRTKNRNWVLLLFLIPFFYVVAFVLFDNAMPINEKRDVTLFLCCFVPLLLLLKSNVKYVVMAILIVVMFFAGKRSSMIFIGIVFASLILSGISNARFKMLKLIGLCAALFAIGYLFLMWFNTDIADYISSFERFNSIAEDGGSGRSEHYSLILFSYANSDLFAQLFGHGPHAVSQSFSMPAHNDLLEVLYDYGALAVLLLIAFWIKVLIFGIRQIKDKIIPKSDAILLFGVILGAIVLTNMNCFITNPLYYILLFAFFGYFVELVNNNNLYEPDRKS